MWCAGAWLPGTLTVSECMPQPHGHAVHMHVQAMSNVMTACLCSAVHPLMCRTSCSLCLVDEGRNDHCSQGLHKCRTVPSRGGTDNGLMQTPQLASGLMLSKATVQDRCWCPCWIASFKISTPCHEVCKPLQVRASPTLVTQTRIELPPFASRPCHSTCTACFTHAHTESLAQGARRLDTH